MLTHDVTEANASIRSKCCCGASGGPKASLAHISLKMITLSYYNNRFFVTALPDINVHDVSFQLHDATCPTSHDTIDSIYQMLDGRLIRRNVDVL